MCQWIREGIVMRLFKLDNKLINDTSLTVIIKPILPTEKHKK